MKLTMTCEECGLTFAVKPYRAGKARFCSQVCGGAWHARTRLNTGDKSYMKGNKLRAGLLPANAFKPGHSPWNSGVKGIHLSPATEYKPGRKSENVLPVGTETIRPDKSGTRRCYVKVSEPNNWKARAVLVWERENGPLPRGKVIHHRDRNALNDKPENLQALTRAEHINEHRVEFIPTPVPKPKQEAMDL